MPKAILITGGTGLIGTRLTEILLESGHSVRYLSRNPDKTDKIPTYKWDIANQEIDKDAFEGVDAIIHLAGAGIADKKWDKARKKVILESRTKSTQLLNKYLKETPNQVKTFVGASAIGYYGYGTGGVWKKEESRFGDDFLATVTKAWEEEVDHISSDNEQIRIVKLRIGIVLSEKGGALLEMARPIKWGVGAPLGPGDQYMSWIHLDDLCRMFQYVVDEEKLKGAYNAVAPNPITNKEFIKITASALHKPLWLPNIPSIVLKIILGEMASMIIGGSRVSNEKIADTGFRYKFDSAQATITDLLKRS